MVCTGRKVITTSLEAKNEKKKELLTKSKAKYKANKAEKLKCYG